MIIKNISLSILEIGDIFRIFYTFVEEINNKSYIHDCYLDLLIGIRSLILNL